MSLLVDYSKHRAEIDPNGSISSLNWNDSFTDVDGHDSFADCSSSMSFSILNHHKLNDSNKTESTASATSEDEQMLYEGNVSFRIKRSSMGMGMSSSQQNQPGDDETSRMMSRSERFQDSMESFLTRRTETDTADAVWKRRRQSILFAPAEIATKSNLNPNASPRRGSMPHLTDATARRRDLMGTEHGIPLDSRSLHVMTHRLEQDTCPPLTSGCTQQIPKSQSHSGHSRRSSIATLEGPRPSRLSPRSPRDRRTSMGSSLHRRYTTASAASSNNRSDFVTGSRIRRFDGPVIATDSFRYNVLGYR